MTLAAHWPTDLSCSLAYWPQLLIGLITLAAHWPTDLSCLLAFRPQLLTGLLTLAPNLLSDLSYLFAWMDVILLFCNHQNKVLQLYSFNRIYWSFWSCFIYISWTLRTQVNATMENTSKIIMLIFNPFNWVSGIFEINGFLKFFV